MDYIELSIKNVEEKSIELAKKIQKEITPDVVIFIAKGSYQIGQEIANFFNVPLLEIFAKRKVGKLKKILSPLLKLIPSSIKKFLREKEINSNIHEGNSERNVYFDENIWSKYKNAKNILIVDDSVDTGNTILQVKNSVEKFYNDSNIYIAGFNVFSKSECMVKTDFYLYKDTMLNGPWSNDSRENTEFSNKYNKWKKAYSNKI